MSSRILIVDDSAVVRALYSYILRSAGYSVVEAENGFAALEALFHTPCDLAIVDVNMPQMDGLTLIREIRASAATARLPIVICSTEREIADREKGFEVGADLYLVKPTEPAGLLEPIRALLNRPGIGRAAAAPDG